MKTPILKTPTLRPALRRARLLMASCAAAMLAAAPAGAQLQPPYQGQPQYQAQFQDPFSAGAGLELYDHAGYQGASVIVDREVANLGPGAFDNMAGSIAVRGGAWEVCDGAGFLPPCRVISDHVPDLRALGLDNRISSIRPVRTGPAPVPPGGGFPPFGPGPGGVGPGGTGPGGVGPGVQPQLTLYDGLDYRGREVSFFGRADNLRVENFDNRARSARVRGDWVLCDGPNLTGRCEQVNFDLPDLGRIAMSRGVSSLAPALQTAPQPPFGPGPGPGQGPGPLPPAPDRMLEGWRAAFFPAPLIAPARLTACVRGDSRSCQAEADRFCRSQSGSWRESAYYSIDRRAGTLTDLLCVR